MERIFPVILIILFYSIIYFTYHGKVLFLFTFFFLWLFMIFNIAYISLTDYFLKDDVKEALSNWWNKQNLFTI